jgi:hypothetical protein
MRNEPILGKGYVLVGVGGIVIGGLTVALATRAIPKIASRVATSMMESMVSRMREGGCDPGEM